MDELHNPSFEGGWPTDALYHYEVLLRFALEPVVIVSFMVHHRCFDEVLRQGGRLYLPLETGGLP
jgi:hypothetical protein